MSAEIEALTALVNGVATVVFLLLLGAVVFSMLRRVHYYRIARMPLPSLLKRGFVFFGALALIGGEAVLLRAMNVQLEMGSIERLIFIVQSDVILIAALAYYAKVELFDLDDDSKP